jgi:ABC-2 type transport system ATP-binding protein
VPLPLSVRQLSKRYGAHLAVDQLEFEVRAGEIYGLLGRNGAGKTTTLECIAGLREPDGGEVWIGGVDGRSQRRRAQEQIGVVLQATAFPDQITVRECLRLFRSFAAQPVPLEELLASFGLAPLAGARFHTLSGGQRQRLALATAFVNRPRLLILDEPSAGLDASLRQDLQAQIRRLAAAGCAVLLTTHDLDEAETLCDRVGVLEQGRLLVEGAPAQLAGARPIVQVVEFITDPPLADDALRGLPGSPQPRSGPRGVAYTTSHAAEFLEQLAQRLLDAPAKLVALEVRGPSLAETLDQLREDRPAARREVE